MYGFIFMAWIAIPVVASASSEWASLHRPLLVQHAPMDEALAADGRRLFGMIERAKTIMEDMLVQLKREATSLESVARRLQLQQALLKLQVETENAELALASLRGRSPAGGRSSRADLDRTMHDLDEAYGVAESLMADQSGSSSAP
jgi:hypothetical protein